MMRTIAAVTMAAMLAVPAMGQEPPKLGPEHKMLKQREGTWDTTMKAGGMEYKGTVTYKMELGGLWLVGSMASDLAGQKFFGKSLDTYDAGKKKYVSVWCDSMSTTPMSMEGTYNPAKKTLTMIGEGPGMDGKLAKWRSVSEMPDKDTIQMSMYVGDGKDPMFTVTYKRKK
ncbi:MAG TPA: DUF1579 family protein [Gemmataceae bacterium]